MRSLLHVRAAALAVLLAGSAGPALAATGVLIPEPTDASLFALALAGLVIGRYAARGPRRDDT
jgi:hypothetical protein